MDSLTMIGHGIFFTFGVVIGAIIMYAGPFIIEAIDEWRKGQEENT